jgi:uncharacterized protein
MNETPTRLIAVLARFDHLTVAVSGGVDSMTLACIAHRHGGGTVSVVHAISPAVPAVATERVRAYAAREGWRLTVLGSGEFDDPSYRGNPTNRCYFCKSCLYDTIGRSIGGTIASGANLDDLDDYRPGLEAAAERGVVHPFIEAGLDKAAVRALAHLEGLDDIAELPAQPCLASRVETGIRIEAEDLAFVDLVERDLRRRLEQRAGGVPLSAAQAPTVRCRITHGGVTVEIGGVAAHLAETLRPVVADLCLESGRAFLGVRPYRRGSAFLGAPAVGGPDR